MYEKLCKILDALREHGYTCKAETSAYSGIWEIVVCVSVSYGVKVIRVPIDYDSLRYFGVNHLLSQILEVVQ